MLKTTVNVKSPIKKEKEIMTNHHTDAFPSQFDCEVLVTKLQKEK